MEEKELVEVVVVISGRKYPLKVSEGEEQIFSDLAAEINSSVQRIQQSYANIDQQDSLSMALLTYAVDLQKARDRESGVSRQSLEHIDQLLDQYLQSSNEG